MFEIVFEILAELIIQIAAELFGEFGIRVFAKKLGFKDHYSFALAILGYTSGCRLFFAQPRSLSESSHRQSRYSRCKPNHYSACRWNRHGSARPTS